MALRNRDRRPEEEAPEPVDTRMQERLAQLERWMDVPVGTNAAEDESTGESEPVAESATVIEPARADDTTASHIIEAVSRSDPAPSGPKTSRTGVVVLPGRRAPEAVPSLRAATAAPRPDYESTTRSDRQSTPISAQLVVEQSQRRQPDSRPAAVKPVRAVVRTNQDVSKPILASAVAGTAAGRAAPRRLIQC